jgi:hypothetical protein
VIAYSHADEANPALRPGGAADTGNCQYFRDADDGAERSCSCSDAYGPESMSAMRSVPVAGLNIVDPLRVDEETVEILKWP